jgi:hypothetical protein
MYEKAQKNIRQYGQTQTIIPPTQWFAKDQTHLFE